MCDSISVLVNSVNVLDCHDSQKLKIKGGGKLQDGRREKKLQKGIFTKQTRTNCVCVSVSFP